MSEFRFTDGNLIILYAQFRPHSSDAGALPEYIIRRIQTCIETYTMVVKSKPDANKSMVVLVVNANVVEPIKRMLASGGIDEKIVAADTESQSVGQAIENVHSIIQSKPNPPFIYFIASYWLQDVFNSTVISKLKGIKVQFYGSLDQRPLQEIEADRAADAPKKGTEYYKRKAQNRAVDMLLNVIFPD